MPKIEVELSPDLNDRLMSFVVRSRGSLYVQRSDVIVEAIKEYLDQNERKVQQGQRLRRRFCRISGILHSICIRLADRLSSPT